MATYQVITGVSYAGKRAEPGDIVTDIPAESRDWLLEQGIIEESASKSNKREQVSNDEGDQ
jgi:hypothetical protein